jgi:hypothetical protein
MLAEEISQLLATTQTPRGAGAPLLSVVPRFPESGSV